MMRDLDIIDTHCPHCGEVFDVPVLTRDEARAVEVAEKIYEAFGKSDPTERLKAVLWRLGVCGASECPWQALARGLDL